MKSKKIVTKTININSPVSKVWEAITNPQIMKLWMSDSVIDIISNWEIGSPISIHGKFDMVSYESKGIILKFEPNIVFQYSYWNKISKVPDIPENYSIIEFRLLQLENQTQLNFTQSNFVGEATFEHARFYWNISLEVMKKLVEKS